MSLQLSIIIVNYNVKYFLEQCLCSVESAIASLQAEVIVVDNHSTDGSITYLQERFPFVQFIANNEIVGFGKANNFFDWSEPEELTNVWQKEFMPRSFVNSLHKK